MQDQQTNKDFGQKKIEILKKIVEVFSECGTKCEIGKEDKEGFTRLIFKEGGLAKTEYFFSIFEADGAGTIGLKVKWVFGEVVDERKVVGCLYGNTVKYLYQGPLFAGILPINNGNDCLFLLLGHLLFPSFTPPDEVAMILHWCAFSNYIMVKETIPGVNVWIQ
jgi:hypothetical protein